MRARLLIGLAGIVAILAVVFLVTRPRPEAAPEEPPRVWSFNFMELARVKISLPKQGLEEAWAKRDDKQFYFEPDGPQVAHDRWGGGVPVILSGPHASRTIVADVDDADLGVYGLASPQMKISLTTDSGDVYLIDVGDRTPTGDANYFRLEDSHDVYTIDYTWYDILERLVTEPPYPNTNK